MYPRVHQEVSGSSDQRATRRAASAHAQPRSAASVWKDLVMRTQTKHACREDSDALTRTTTVLLVRHGESDGLGERLVGRTRGVVLTHRGRAQAERLPVRLRRLTASLDALYVSPQRRAFESAVPIGRHYGLVLQRAEAFAEADFGDWTGRRFDELDRDPAWRVYNSARATALVPRGESAADLQRRVESALQGLVDNRQNQTIAVVTHAEVIRTIVLGVTGRTLDEFQTVLIDPASITAIRYRGRQGQLLFVNASEEVAAPMSSST
jgi:probable phosphoglycerate mutase